MTNCKRCRQKPLWLLLIVGQAILASGCGQSANVDEKNLFNAGRRSLMRGEFQNSISQLRQYLKQFPHEKHASRASFLIAKSQLGTGDYKAARQQFEATIAEYADSEEAHKSRYKLAMLSLLEGDHDAARAAFEALTTSPSGTLVPEATAMVRYIDQLPDQQRQPKADVE